MNLAKYIQSELEKKLFRGLKQREIKTCQDVADRVDKKSKEIIQRVWLDKLFEDMK